MVRTQHHRRTAVRLENKVRARVQDGIMKAATVALSPWQLKRISRPSYWEDNMVVGNAFGFIQNLDLLKLCQGIPPIKKTTPKQAPYSKSHPLCPALGWVISLPMNVEKRVHRFSEVDGQWQASAVHCLWEGSGGLQVFRDSHLWVNRSRDGLIYQRYEKCN